MIIIKKLVGIYISFNFFFIFIYKLSIHSIDKIKIPVLFLQSFDDPILSKSTLPFDEIKLNPNLIMVVTNIGFIFL